MAFNITNFGIITGRLTADPRFFPNRDGSQKVMLTVASENNYRNSHGERDSQFIPLEAFISANTPASVYNLIRKGDLVSCEICIRNNNYRDKSGEQVYGLSLQIDTIKIMEPKHITDARHAESVA